MQHFKFSVCCQVVFLTLLLFASCGQRELSEEDWEPNYKSRSTLPYGTYIAYNLLDSIFSNGDIYRTDYKIEDEIYDLLDYNYYQLSYNEDTDAYSEIYVEQTDSSLTKFYEDYQSEDIYSYIIITKDFEIDNISEVALCDFVGTGNHVFLSAETINESLLSRLSLLDEKISIMRDSVYALEEIMDKKYSFPPLSERIGKKSSGQTSFLRPDKSTLPYKVLGEDGAGNPTFVKIKYGYGYFYLHTAPRAFTNIVMLNIDQYDYGFRCLSYLPEDSYIIWDESIKPGSSSKSNGGILSVLLNSQPLKWGFVVLILGLLLFMLFRGKREQRVIPVIVKPQNTSLAFLNTLSNMYYKKKDYWSSMKKRHAFFLEFIRKSYYIDTETIDVVFFKSLSAKSNVPQYIIERIFKYYNYANEVGTVGVDTYMNYNKELESFYKIVKNKQQDI